MDTAVNSVIDVSVERKGAFYSVALPNGALAEGSIEHVIRSLDRALLSLALEESAGLPLIGAAAVVLNGVRTLFVGGDGSARTMLLLRLLQEGFTVEGDRWVSFDGHFATAFPQTLRVKSKYVKALPELAGWVTDCPFIHDWYGERVHSVVPSLAGLPWRIASGPVGNLVFLERNEGGRSVMGPIDRSLALGRLLATSLLPQKGGAIANLAGLLQVAKQYELVLGEIDRAVWHLTHGIGGEYRLPSAAVG
jgi:hypothetical protein